MTNYITKIKLYILAHKILSVILLCVVLYISYFSYNKITSTAGDTRYVLSQVTKGTLVSSVTGSGQVSALNQVDIKAKASGDAIYIAATSGQKVTTGALILELDASDAQKTVRDAQVNLESANISLSKLKIQNSSDNLNTDLAKAYDDGFNTVSNTFLDLPGIVNGLSDMFFKSTISTNGQWNVDWYEGQVDSSDNDAVKIYKQNFVDSYNLAFKAYGDNFDQYKSVSRTSDNTTIENIVTQTYDTVKLVSDAVKNANNYIDFVNNSIKKRSGSNPPAIIATNKTTLNDYTSKTNTHLMDLLSTTTEIKTNKDAFSNSDLDIQSAELSVKQKENALQDAKDKLADYFIRAPFDGTLADVNIKKTDSVSAGTIAATLITAKQLAEISFNEVDVAKIAIGQKATLTFDAIPDLTISGVVADMDSVGTVSQGVVTYMVKVGFDTQDIRIKPGMSVSAAIITDVKQDVLIVPNSAVKSSGGTSYVENFDSALPAPTDRLIGSISKIAPNKIEVVTGISNDSQTEIISGIKEGDAIVTRTILPTTTATVAAPSIFGSTTGGNRATAGAVRIPAGR